MSDQPVAEAAVYTTHNSNLIRTPISSSGFETAADLRLKPHGHRDRLYILLILCDYSTII